MLNFFLKMLVFFRKNITGMLFPVAMILCMLTGSYIIYEAFKKQNSLEALYVTIIIICVNLILLLIYLTYSRGAYLKYITMKLKNSQRLFKAVFRQAPIGVAVYDELDRYKMMNNTFKKILCRTRKELYSLNWTQITHPDDLAGNMELYKKFKAGEIDRYEIDKRYLRPDGSFVWAHIVVAGLQPFGGRGRWYICILQDIHEKKLAEEALRESERSKSVILANLPGMAYRCKYDRDWTMLFVSEGCLKLTGYKPDSLLYNRELSFNDLISEKYREIILDEWARVIQLKLPFKYEYEIVCSNGERKWVLEMGQGIYAESGEVEALEGIVIDISEQKKREAEIKYISEHDYLTGLYNLSYMERILPELDEKYLPLTVMIADINSLQLINDAFSHSEGDRLLIKCSRILQGCCSTDDIIVRTGGDEFIILMPHKSSNEAYNLLKLIKSTCAAYNEGNKAKKYELSMSLGFSTRVTTDENIEETFRKAHEYLRNSKLLERKSSHSSTVSSIMAAVYEKSQETEEHAKRLVALTRKIGEKLNLSPKSLNELELLAMLHDIGKVTIDDQVLNKNCQLNDEEWTAMKKHPEAGYRIAKAVPELEPIADLILAHHEHWDGTGYPRGLKGEEVPLLSRILAIADAYDAMTHDRAYRKAFTKEEAIGELAKNMGTQFDPFIVKLFIENI